MTTSVIYLLNYSQDYFKINYPLPKCDLIAIDDFTGGAMENWGLITFRSSCILFDEEKSSTATKVSPKYPLFNCSFQLTKFSKELLSLLRMSWPICGSEIWSPSNGGHIYG